MIRLKKNWIPGLVWTSPFLFMALFAVLFGEVAWAKIAAVLVYVFIACLACLASRRGSKRRGEQVRNPVATNASRTAAMGRRASHRNAVVRSVNRQSVSGSRITRRIFRPTMLSHGVPNPARRVARRAFNSVEIEILEQRPQVRETTWNIGGRNVRLVKRELAFPYLDFRIVFFKGLLDSLFVFYANSPSNGSGETRLYPPNLCNVAENGRICLGRGVEELRLKIYKLGRERQIESILNYFWYESAFDLSHLPDANYLPWKHIEPRLSSLDAWERSTLRNPRFILSVDWEKRGRWVTAEELLDPIYDTGG